MTAPVAEPIADGLTDYEPPCSLSTRVAHGKVVACQDPAKWSARTPCCGVVALVCDHHRNDHGPFRCSCGRHSADLIGWARL